MARRADWARADRPPLDVLSGSTRTSRPRRRRPGRRGGGVEVRDDRDRDDGRGRARGTRWPTARSSAARHPPPRRLAARCGRCLARRRPARARASLGLLRGGSIDFDTLDLGGGFPVRPLGEPVPGPSASPASSRRCSRRSRRPPPDAARVEPGRALVARAGWLVARVLHVRDRGAARQVVLDAGMTELIRPALYGARHPIVALTSLGRPDAGRRSARSRPRADPRRRARSANRPTPSARTTCRRCVAATSSPSPTPAPMRRRSARPTTAVRARRRSSSNRTGRCGSVGGAGASRPGLTAARPRGGVRHMLPPRRHAASPSPGSSSLPRRLRGSSRSWRPCRRRPPSPRRPRQ